MTHQSAPSYAPGGDDAGEQVAQLRHVLALVEQIAGQASTAPGDEALDEAARISSLYASALPIVQRRFDGFATETVTWAATGIDALVTLQERGQAPEPAASRLAETLRKSLDRLARMLRRDEKGRN